MAVVGAAIVREGKLLSCRRTEPPALAGQWEFPGGKVEPGESAVDALVRECEEELGLTVDVGARLGGDVPLGTSYLLQVYWCTIAPDAVPQRRDHDEFAWLDASSLFDVNWIEADLGLVALAAAALVARQP